MKENTVNNSEKGLSAHLYTWSTLGPIFAFGNFCILLAHPSQLHSILSIVLILGLILSAQKKKYGFLTSLCLLAAVFLFQLPLSLSFWEAGIFISIGINFFVAALSSEEVEDLLYAITAESRVRNKQLNLVEEAFKTLKKESNQEKDSFRNQLDPLRKNLADLEKNYNAQQELLSAAQQQLTESTHEKKALKSIVETRESEIQQLNEQLEAQRALAIEIEPLKEQLKKRDQELFNLQFQLNSAIEDHRLAQTVSEQSMQEIVRLQELSAIHEELSEKSQEEQILQQAVQYELNEHIETLSREKDLLESMLKKLQDELEEVRLCEKNLLQWKDEALAKEDLIQALQKQLKDSEEQRLSLSEEIKNFPAPVEPCGLSLSLSNEPDFENEQIARRRSEAMYLQLREQFLEKSALLDKTRRELFHAQEQILKHQKEMEEEHTYGQGKTEEALLNHINCLSKDLEEMRLQYEREIDHLHTLVSTLTKN